MKRRLLIVIAASVAPILLVVGGSAAFLVTLPWDIAPADDGHLRREPLVLPAESNAFAHYRKAIESIDYPEGGRRFLDTVYEGEEWDDGLVRDVLDRNARTLSLVAEGNRCERCIVRSEVPLSGFGDVRRLLFAEATYHLRRQEFREAFRSACTLLELGCHLEADAGSSLYYLVGTGMRVGATRTMRNLVRGESLDGEQLRELQGLLNANRPSTQGFILAVRSDYEAFVDNVDQLYRGDVPLGDDTIDCLPTWVQRYRIRYALNPNSTKRDMAILSSKLIDLATDPDAGIGPTKVDELIDEYTTEKRAAMAEVGVRGKRVIQIEYMMCANRFSGSKLLVQRLCEADVCHVATATLAALHLFYRGRGHFPDSLAALVPEFMSAVPRDAYDGRPLRYSREMEILYSVGEDLQDSGGSTELRPGEQAETGSDKQRKARDYVFRVREERQEGVRPPSR